MSPARTTPAGRIDVTQHLAWAEKVGKAIAREYHFRKAGQEEDEIVAVAYLHAVRCADRYTGETGDVDHFRGYAYVSVVAECRREARRLRNGGTYWTRKEKRGEVIDVSPLSDLAGRDGEGFDTEAKEGGPACLWA